MAHWGRVAGLIQAGILLTGWTAAAQIKMGDLSASLTGTVSPGYSADWGNQTSSDHSWLIGGAGTLSGSYYTPNFLSYNASFYLNQSRANSNFQSISNASGVNLTSNIFGGSHFPGEVNYSTAYNSQGNYGVPGLANYVTNGNSDTFGVNWSENLPDAPSLSAGYQRGNSQYSVYGANDEGNTAFDSVTLHSGYRIAGFSMGAYYSRGASNSLIPEVVSGQTASTTQATNDAYGFTITHLLPLQGSASGGVSRTDWSSNYLGSQTSGTVDLVTGVAAIHPTEKLSVTADLNYSDNLSGQLIESVLAAGGVVAGANASQSSNSLDLIAVATYAPLAHLQTSASIERRTQNYLGEDYAVTSYGVSGSYLRQILHGTFNGSASLTENSSNQTAENTIGFSTTENYSTVLLGWHLDGSFGYSQNAQTLLVTYTNSFYNYNATARRGWREFSMSVGAGGGRTGLTQQPGVQSSSESYNGSIGFGRWLTASGNYSDASGQALATGAGLVTEPVLSPTLPSTLLSLYGGRSYSAAVSSSPLKKLIVASAYSRSNSNISSDGIATTNENTQFNTLVQYQTRKLYFTTGYARLQQGFGTPGLQPAIVSSFYIGVSRWFNVF